MLSHGFLITLLVLVFVVTQILYAIALSMDLYSYTRPIDWVLPETIRNYRPEIPPLIVLLYPVLREREELMRTTFLDLEKLDYPADRYRIVAIPNHDDAETLASLLRLQDEFSFLEVLAVPATSDESWNVVWDAWEGNEKAYWWHVDSHKGRRALPAKKTRQLIYAFYTLAAEIGNDPGWLLDYIDADSAPPVDHLWAGAAGSQQYDVLQATNVAGNLLDSWAASWHAFDHMAWDGLKYPRFVSGGKQPYWMLGKGLFYRGSDLLELGGFNPWLTIEDPEVGLRFWANGKRIGLIAAPLVEEVPNTLRAGIIQRKRWVCGFLQASYRPPTLIGMPFRVRMRARMNMWPCLFLSVNPIGIPIGIWAAVVWVDGTSPLSEWFWILCAVNLLAFTATMTLIYTSTWKRTLYVLHRRRDRLRYMWRVNPVAIFVYWLTWTIGIAKGTAMFLADSGQTWERTEKTDANHQLVRELVAHSEAPTDHEAPASEDVTPDEIAIQSQTA